MYRFYSSVIGKKRITDALKTWVVISGVKSFEARELVSNLKDECQAFADFAYTKDGFSTILLSTLEKHRLLKSPLCKDKLVQVISEDLSYYYRTNLIVKPLRASFLNDFQLGFVFKHFKNDCFYIRLRNYSSFQSLVRKVVNEDMWLDKESVVQPIFANKRHISFQTDCLVANEFPNTRTLMYRGKKYILTNKNSKVYVSPRNHEEFRALLEFKYDKTYFEPLYNENSLNNSLKIKILDVRNWNPVPAFINEFSSDKPEEGSSIMKAEGITEIKNSPSSIISCTLDSKSIYSNKLYLKDDKEIQELMKFKLAYTKFGRCPLTMKSMIYFSSITDMNKFLSTLPCLQDKTGIYETFTYVPFWMYRKKEFIEFVEPWFLRDVVKVVSQRINFNHVKLHLKRNHHATCFFVEEAHNNLAISYFRCKSAEEALKLVFLGQERYGCDIEILSYMSSKCLPYVNMFTLQGFPAETSSIDVLKWLSGVRCHSVIKYNNLCFIFLKSPSDVHALMKHQFESFRGKKILIKQYESKFKNCDSLSIRINGLLNYTAHEQSLIRSMLKFPELKVPLKTLCPIDRLQRNYSLDMLYSSGKAFHGKPIILGYTKEKNDTNYLL